MRCLVVSLALTLAGAPAALAQENKGDGPAVGSYEDEVACAGRFRWVLDASSGGQPALNEYSLEERVGGVEAYLERAEAVASADADVEGDVQTVADEVMGAAFDDPDTVEAELMACAIVIGMREG